MNIQRKWLATGLALTAGIAVAAGAAATDEKNNTGFSGLVKSWWQEELLPRIREASVNGGAASPAHTASSEFREEKERYLLRLTLPERTLGKVDVELSGETLRISAPAEKGLPRYEHSVLVPDAADDPPQVERKPGEHLMVITVPKTSAGADPSGTDFGVFAEPFRFGGDEKEFLAHMDRLHRRMNRLWKEMTPDAFLPASGMPEKQSPEIEEKDDAYVITIPLSGQSMENIGLKAEARTLRVEVKEEDRKEQDGKVRSQRFHSSRMLTLPGPVDPAKMTTERLDGVLKVTLPKAG